MVTDKLSITIKPVVTSQEKNNFIKVPKLLYRNSPHWIAPLDQVLKNQLNSQKNPLFNKLTAHFWVAYDGINPVGRISAQINDEHLQRHHPNEGHFGFLEANSFETMQQLITTAETWLKKKGMTQVLGPFNLSINEESGLLIDGFNTPPYMMMPHHHPYYHSWLTALGFIKAKDLLALKLDLTQPFSKKWSSLMKRASTTNVKTHTLNMNRFHHEIDSSFALFNAAWQSNWGFLPFDIATITHLKSELKLILNPSFCISATLNNQKIGFMYAFPNINDAIYDLNGKLFPFGWLKLLYRLKLKSLKTARVVFGGIDPSIQNSYLGGKTMMLLIDHIATEGRKKGIHTVETSWVLEDNIQLLKVLEILDIKVYKRYRIFSKSIA